MFTTNSYGMVRGTARKYPYFQAHTYVIAINRRTKKAYMCHTGAIGTARRSYEKALREAKEYGGRTFIPHIRHGHKLATMPGFRPAKSL